MYHTIIKPQKLFRLFNSLLEGLFEHFRSVFKTSISNDENPRRTSLQHKGAPVDEDLLLDALVEKIYLMTTKGDIESTTPPR